MGPQPQVPFSLLPQSVREEHQGYEQELSRLRAQYEEEVLRFQEAQVRALQQLQEKHQALSQEAQHEKEEEKQRLTAVRPQAPSSS